MDLSKFKSAVISGTLSGCITSITFQPLEVIKTRLQQPSNSNKTIYQVIHETYKTSGSIRVFWYGLTPSICRAVPVVAIYFTSIETLKNQKLFKTSNKLYNEFIATFLVGASARTISLVSMFPLSLIKTHYESDLYSHKNMLNAFKMIIKENGLRGLYRGLSPTLIRDINYSGIYYMIYSKLKKSVNDDNDSKKIAFNALFSGTFACFITQPPDVIRTRMQLQPLIYKSFFQTIKKIYHEHGLKGFFIGFIPRSTRRILITVLSWTIFEKIKIKLE